MNLHKDKFTGKIKSNIIPYFVALTVFAFIICVPKKVGASGDDSLFGRVDPFTGELISSESAGTEANKETIVKLSDTGYYDTEQGLYGYHTELGDIYATVADGMITREKVTVYIPEGMQCNLYRDGYASEFTGGEITDIGGYTVEAVTETNVTQLFSFVITGSASNKILNYTVPSGFRIYNATRNGEEIAYSRGFVDMSEEGEYRIDYDLSSAGLTYSLVLTVDVTPPTLTLVGTDEQGRARGPVTLTGKGEDDTLSVTKDGEPVSMILTYTFTQSGKYVATVTDPAGNVTEYPFTIMIYLDRNGWIFGALLLAVIAAVVGYVLYKRKHLKVR